MRRVYGHFRPSRPLRDAPLDQMMDRAVHLVCQGGGCHELPVEEWCMRCLAWSLARRLQKIQSVIDQVPAQEATVEG